MSALDHSQERTSAQTTGQPTRCLPAGVCTELVEWVPRGGIRADDAFTSTAQTNVPMLNEAPDSRDDSSTIDHTGGDHFS